mmetsp:Transcript_83663/g.259952  ORF Transcript_83663/g.259952 Transcript_83663/m.259952 type:complete len:228 (+) Transcript_83663:172-855(+)
MQWSCFCLLLASSARCEFSFSRCASMPLLSTTGLACGSWLISFRGASSIAVCVAAVLVAMCFWTRAAVRAAAGIFSVAGAFVGGTAWSAVFSFGANIGGGGTDAGSSSTKTTWVSLFTVIGRVSCCLSLSSCSRSWSFCARSSLACSRCCLACLMSSSSFFLSASSCLIAVTWKSFSIKSRNWSSFNRSSSFSLASSRRSASTSGFSVLVASCNMGCWAASLNISRM